MPECERCHDIYNLGLGSDPTKYCNDCAHERCEELETQLEAVIAALDDHKIGNPILRLITGVRIAREALAKIEP